MKYTLIIDRVPSDKNEFLRVIRTIGALDLSHASDIKNYILENVPCPVVAGIDKDVAEYISDKITDAGGKCSITESPSISFPMVLNPAANQKYDFGFLGFKKVD